MEKSKFVKKVMLLDHWEMTKNKSVAYKVCCSCGGDSCGITIDFDYDFALLELRFYKEVGVYDRTDDLNIFERIPVYWRRFKKAVQLMMGNPIPMEDEFVFQDEEHVRNFINALEEGMELMLAHENADRVLDLKKEI